MYRQEDQKYTILLIIADGNINDMELTKAAIIEASTKPMSIVIVGVGSQDFSDMKELDSDDHLLSHEGRTASRDIVQFVNFNDAMAKGPGALAKEVLEEVGN